MSVIAHTIFLLQTSAIPLRPAKCRRNHSVGYMSSIFANMMANFF